MGPYASSRSLVAGRTLSGASYADHQGFYLDETKSERECDDPSLGRFRRVRDLSHPESIIVLMDDLPSIPHREGWGTESPYCLASPVASPYIDQPKETGEKLPRKGSLVSRAVIAIAHDLRSAYGPTKQRASNHSNPNRTMLERVDEQALSSSVIDVHQPTLPDLK